MYQMLEKALSGDNIASEINIFVNKHFCEWRKYYGMAWINE